MPPASDPHPLAFHGFCTPSLAGDIALLSIGPRVGFSGGSPLLGKRQTESFRMADVAAVFTLPWSWPLGGSAWSLETRLTASAGLLEAAGDSSLIMTVVPGLALSGWKGLVSFDAGAGAGFFSNYKFGVARLRGAGSTRRDHGGSHQSIFSRLYRLSLPTLLRCRPIRIVQSRRGPVHRRTWIPVLTRTSPDRRSFRARTTRHHPTTLRLPS